MECRACSYECRGTVYHIWLGRFHCAHPYVYDMRSETLALAAALFLRRLALA